MSLELNHIYCEDCFDTIERIKASDYEIDNIITSPFYNTNRSTKCYNSEKSRLNYDGRYDVHLDDMSNEEYMDFTIRLFNEFDNIVKENGCILYNISYGSENTECMWLVVAEIIKQTKWTVADDIIWKKQSALPNNASSNKLTRIVEHIFVFCRKTEFKTFSTNKKVKSVSETGQKFYENVFNYIEAPNNDESCNLNKATYSTNLVEQLIDMYVSGGIVYDPFMGTGTTANACALNDIDYIGSELSEAQVDYANERITKNKNKKVKVRSLYDYC